MPLGNKELGKLCGVCRFTRTLKTAHHNHGGSLGGGVYSRVASTHESGQLLVDDFNNSLRRGKAFGNILADCLFCDGVGEIFGDLVVNVGLKKGKPYLPHGFADVAFGQLAAALNMFKGVCKLVGKSFKSQR